MSVAIDRVLVFGDRWSEQVIFVTLGQYSRRASTSASGRQVSIIVLLYLVAHCLCCNSKWTAVCLSLFCTVKRCLLMAVSFTEFQTFNFLLDSCIAVLERIFEQPWAYHRREEDIEDCIAPSLPSITNSLRDNVGMHNMYGNNYRFSRFDNDNAVRTPLLGRNGVCIYTRTWTSTLHQWPCWKRGIPSSFAPSQNGAYCPHTPAASFTQGGDLRI